MCTARIVKKKSRNNTLQCTRSQEKSKKLDILCVASGSINNIPRLSRILFNCMWTSLGILNNKQKHSLPSKNRKIIPNCGGERATTELQEMKSRINSTQIRLSRVLRELWKLEEFNESLMARKNYLRNIA